MKRLIFILLSTIIIPHTIWATDSNTTIETIIVGDVYDAYTGLALPNVNIYFQGTNIGTTSNPEGLFVLRGLIARQRIMVVSAVGYHPERFRIMPGQQVGVEIALREKVGQLSEVFVTPGTNPALPLMQQVRLHRHANQRNIDSNQIHAQTALYVSDIQSKHL